MPLNELVSFVQQRIAIKKEHVIRRGTTSSSQEPVVDPSTDRRVLLAAARDPASLPFAPMHLHVHMHMGRAKTGTVTDGPNSRS